MYTSIRCAQLDFDVIEYSKWFQLNDRVDSEQNGKFVWRDRSLEEILHVRTSKLLFEAFLGVGQLWLVLLMEKKY